MGQTKHPGSVRYQVQETDCDMVKIMDIKRSRYLKKPQGNDLFTRHEASKLVGRKNSRYQTIQSRKT